MINIFLIFIIVLGCCLGILDYTDERNEYVSRLGIINILKRQYNYTVQINDYLSVSLGSNQNIIIYMQDEQGVIYELQKITSNKKESDFIYRTWRRPIIQKMKQIRKNERKEEYKLEQYRIKQKIENKYRRKEFHKQYYKKLNNNNRENHKKYKKCFKKLEKKAGCR